MRYVHCTKRLNKVRASVVPTTMAEVKIEISSENAQQQSLLSFSQLMVQRRDYALLLFHAQHNTLVYVLCARIREA